MKLQSIAVPSGRAFVLVYQAGLANVFHVLSVSLDAKDTTGQWADRRRVYQGDFRTAESICYGAGLAGRVVRTVACNMPGDIALQTWTEDLDEQPFNEKFHPQMWN